MLRTASSTATLDHVVILDGTIHLFHAGLERAEFDANAQAESQLVDAVFRMAVELVRPGVTLEGAIATDEITGTQVNRHTVVLEEGTAQIQTVEEIARTLALQVIAACTSATPNAKLELPRQILTETAPGIRTEAAVVILCDGRLIVGIIRTGIEVETRPLRNGPVGERVERRHLGMLEIAIGRVLHAVLDERIADHAIVRKAIGQRGVDAELRGEGIERKVQVVGLFTA